METNEVSEHLCKVFMCVRSSNGWVTAKDVSAASGVAERTSRAHLSRLVKLGLFDQAETFPAHRYRMSTKAGKRNISMLQRIESACSIFFPDK